MYLPANLAAMAPSETAVTTCLKGLTLKSPAANTPFKFVSMVSVVLTKPFSSVSIMSLKGSVAGFKPMNTNIPLILSSLISSVNLSL